MTSIQSKESNTDTQVAAVSPISMMQTPIDDEKHVVISPVERVAYFPDDKICMAVGDGLEAAPAAGYNVPPQIHSPAYAEGDLPKRPQLQPFWKRYLIAILASAVILIIVVALAAGISVASHHKGSKNQVQRISMVTNNTKNSVASSGLFLKGGSTWNMHIFSQNSTGGISLQIALDGNQFEAAQNVSLTIAPRIGSPLSATTEQDLQTGVIMVNLFYLSGDHNITMSAIACEPGSANCNTISNCLLPTDIPVNDYTGLSAVNVDNAEDWRVYYQDNQGYISQLQGNSSAFARGERIGGSALNASSIAAVNINSTTNNIVLFFVDNYTKDLYTMQFTDGAWTTPLAVSAESFAQWNPLSGLGAAYTSGLDQIQVFFTGLDSKIYEYIGSNASQTINTAWSQQPTGQRVWATADYVGADVTAIGWKNQVRFFQVSQKMVIKGALNNQTWTESFI